jgi:hypothetical protein
LWEEVAWLLTGQVADKKREFFKPALVNRHWLCALIKARGKYRACFCLKGEESSMNRIWNVKENVNLKSNTPGIPLRNQKTLNDKDQIPVVIAMKNTGKFGNLDAYWIPYGSIEKMEGIF